MSISFYRLQNSGRKESLDIKNLLKPRKLTLNSILSWIRRRDGTKTVKGPYLVSNVEQPEAVKRVVTWSSYLAYGLTPAVIIPLVNSTIQYIHFRLMEATSTCLQGTRESLVLFSQPTLVAISFKNLPTRFLKDCWWHWSTSNHCWNLQNIHNNSVPTCLLPYSWPKCPLSSPSNN